jgi:hypothetical protein
VNFVSACTLCEDKDLHRADPPSVFFLILCLGLAHALTVIVPLWATVSRVVQVLVLIIIVVKIIIIIIV